MPIPLRCQDLNLSKLAIKSSVVLVCLFATVASSHAEEIIPTAIGTTWKYNMTQEAGEGFRLSSANPEEGGKLRAPVIYRINGTRDVNGKKLLEFEMHRGGLITNTDLIAVDEHGISCWARADEHGELTKFETAQVMVTAPLTPGLTWEWDGKLGEERVHQFYRVLGEEDVTVPAGKFRAVHIHGEQSLPGKMTIDRWFVDGIGIIKDVTETRSDEDDLLRQISLELTERPTVSPRPDVKPAGTAQKITATLGRDAIGEATAEFVTNTSKIYARWQGNALRYHSQIRAVWIAEEVEGVAPPDYIVDEANTTATASDSHGIFALAKPENGWLPGVYRVEFYVDGAFAEAVKLRIRPAPPAFEN